MRAPLPPIAAILALATASTTLAEHPTPACIEPGRANVGLASGGVECVNAFPDHGAAYAHASTYATTVGSVSIAPQGALVIAGFASPGPASTLAVAVCATTPVGEWRCALVQPLP